MRGYRFNRLRTNGRETYESLATVGRLRIRRVDCVGTRRFAILWGGLRDSTIGFIYVWLKARFGTRMTCAFDGLARVLLLFWKHSVNLPCAF
jgi:hypothetical protein